MRVNKKTATGVLLYSVLGLVVGEIFYQWLRFIYDISPDTGPGSMKRGLENISHTHVLINTLLAILAVRVLITIVIKIFKKLD